jgi:hypothetical protein
MPEHYLHETIDLIVLGKKYSEVHKFMDSMQPFLQANHRRYYHDMATVNKITQVTGDVMAGEAAYLHILLDSISLQVGHAESVPMLLKLIQSGKIKL